MLGLLYQLSLFNKLEKKFKKISVSILTNLIPLTLPSQFLLTFKMKESSLNFPITCLLNFVSHGFLFLSLCDCRTSSRHFHCVNGAEHM